MSLPLTPPMGATPIYDANGSDKNGCHGDKWRCSHCDGNQQRIKDFPGGGGTTPKLGVLTYYFAIFFAENCMKMK